jgi:hypothetical protein
VIELNVTDAPPPSLSELTFSAKIDYVTIKTTRQVQLPALSGKPKWPPSFNGERLTVHDPSAADVVLLRDLFPRQFIHELEIAVDIRPCSFLSEGDFHDCLTRIKAGYLARQLMPVFPAGLSSGFRGTYQRLSNGYKLTPFNLRVPQAHEQHLHGRRIDGAQVKVYLKKLDNMHALPWKAHSVRVEIRLGLSGLDAHGLLHLSDLDGWRLRKELMPYFQHVKGTKRRAATSKNAPTPLRKLLTAKSDQVDQLHWNKVGVGAFLPGGKRDSEPVRFLRHQELNQRIGQALLRLQSKLSTKKFVCCVGSNIAGYPESMRLAAIQGQSPMTY